MSSTFRKIPNTSAGTSLLKSTPAWFLHQGLQFPTQHVQLHPMCASIFTPSTAFTVSISTTVSASTSPWMSQGEPRPSSLPVLRFVSLGCRTPIIRNRRLRTRTRARSTTRLPLLQFFAHGQCHYFCVRAGMRTIVPAEKRGMDVQRDYTIGAEGV